ncbi:ORFL267C [Human betaherpesvirus 5]|nr:ORFL267C [Human betaherpesvirus 5]QHX40647.1 ORFL267C [Human betaherpesvirus 5]
MGSSPVAAELLHPSPAPMPPATHGRSAAPCS